VICDSHVHLKHGDSVGTEYSPEVIIGTMDKVGIDKSVVFAMSTTTRHSIEMAQDAVRRFPGRLIPYVYALPSFERPVLSELDEAISERNFRGIKVHAGECGLAEYLIDPVLALAGGHDVPCLIDCCGNYDAAERMAENFPQTKLILAHLGRYLCTDEELIDRFIDIAERFSNVFLDVSGVVVIRKITEAVGRVGSNRILWGSDGPFEAPDTIGFARTELDKIRTLPLDERQRDDVLGGTIASLLKSY